MKHIKSHFIFARLHHLLYATLALMAGITMQFLGAPLHAQLLIVALIIMNALIYHQLYGLWQPLLLITPLFFASGSLLCFMQQETVIKAQNILAKNNCALYASVSSIEKIQHLHYNYKLLLDTDQIQTIAIYCSSLPHIIVGDYIEIEPLRFKKSNNQSFNNYLAKEKIMATLFVDQFNCKLIERPKLSAARIIFYAKEKIFNTLRHKINYESFPLFSSIFLGNRSSVKKQMDSKKEPFKVWGTSHYLARSGLHLVIFVVIWHFILSLLPIAYLLKQLFLIMLILIYALFSWSSVSFERALLMVLLYKWCLLNRSASHYIHLITVATLIVLLFNPLQLFFLDFQLSFGITFALAWFNHIEAHKKRAIA